MNKYRKSIAEKLKEDGINVAEKKIREIIIKDNSQFNLIWIPHIKDDSQNEFPDRYEIQLTFFIRDCLLESNLGKLRKKVEEYIKDYHPIFRRLAIHCIDKKYNELKEIFWGIKDNPIEYLTIKHELYPFFENHAKEFSVEEIKRIINWIENKDFSYLDSDEQMGKNKEVIIAYGKKDWFSAIIHSKSSEVNALYK